MTSQILTPSARTDVGATPDPTAADERPTRHDRRWAAAGLAAGITGLGAIASSMQVDAVYDAEIQGDSVAIADRLGDFVPQLLAFHVLGVVSAVLMIVFAAGLHRRLRATGGDGLAPAIAATGVIGTALVMILGTGLDTEFIFAVASDDALVDPANATFFNHWIGTVPWCWGLMGLAGVALYAASRAGGVARWLGLVGLLGGGVTLLLGISPLQYMAGMTGPIGLIVVALGFLVGDRVFRGRA